MLPRGRNVKKCRDGVRTRQRQNLLGRHRRQLAGTPDGGALRRRPREEASLPRRLRRRSQSVAAAHTVVVKARESQVGRLRAATFGNREQVVDLQQVGGITAAPGERIAIAAAPPVAQPDVTPDRRGNGVPYRRPARTARSITGDLRRCSGPRTAGSTRRRHAARHLRRRRSAGREERELNAVGWAAAGELQRRRRARRDQRGAGAIRYAGADGLRRRRSTLRGPVRRRSGPLGLRWRTAAPECRRHRPQPARPAARPWVSCSFPAATMLPACLHVPAGDRRRAGRAAPPPRAPGAPPGRPTTCAGPGATAGPSVGAGPARTPGRCSPSR